MNTRKQVLIMSGLLLMMLVIVAIYAAWYPSRAEDAESHFEEATTERDALLFARNCRLCHGDVGEGGQLGGRLPAAPALNRPDLQGFKDSTATLTAEVNPSVTTIEVNDGNLFGPEGIILIDEERMQVTRVDGNTVTVKRGYEGTTPQGHFPEAKIWAFDEALLAENIELITNTVTCGRVGTAMQPWAQSQGGPISEEQIRQLSVLITTASWHLVEEEADVEDVMGAGLTAPLASEATLQISDLPVTDVTLFEVDDVIRVDQEQMRVAGLPTIPPDTTGPFAGNLTVVRGVEGTTPEAHNANTTVALLPGETETTGLTADVAAAGTAVSEMAVTDVTRFTDEEAIRIGEERLRIKALPAFPPTATNIPGNILVERGIYGTSAEEHTPEIPIFKFPEAPDPASINEASCGQTAQPAPVTGPCPDEGGAIQISADNTAFNCSEIEATANSPVTVAFTNLEATVHNIAFYTDDTAAAPAAEGSADQVPFAGPDVTEEVSFTAPEAGEYFFRCDVHPQQMTGTFTVN